MIREQDESDQYECVDPLLGQEMWRLDAPEADATLRRALENHLAICHACRMAVAFEDHLPNVLSARRRTRSWKATRGDR